MIEEIVEKVLLMQANSAAQQHRPLGRGTHAKGICARAQFEVFDVTVGTRPCFGGAARQGNFRRSLASIRPSCGLGTPIRSELRFQADVRSLSFSVDLTRDGTAPPGRTSAGRISRCKTRRTLPINDATAFLAIMKLLTASNPAAALWALPFKDKLRVLTDALRWCNCRRTRKSSLISNCATGATCRFATGRSMS